MEFGVSQPRDEDGLLLKGEALFSGDRAFDREVWLYVVRSEYAAGQITSIDLSEAKDMEGVHAILTGADAEAKSMNSFELRYRPLGTEVTEHPVRPLAERVVRYVGEPVAVIVADTEAVALDAAEAIQIDIDPSDAVTDARKADTESSPPIWPEGNTVFTQKLGNDAGYETALKEAAHVVTARIDISSVAAVTLEPRNGLAVPTEDGLTLYTGSQAPHRVRAEAAHVLGLEEQKLRIVATQVGGSFGMRNGCYPEDVLALWAARHLDRPVRWRNTRTDSFLSDTLSRAQSVDVTLALDSEHRFLAVGVEGFAPIGGYVGPMSLHPMTSSLPAIAGVYCTPIIHTFMQGMHVNTMHMAPYRGAGRPEAIFVIERIIDIAARHLGVDRAELRRRNMIQPDQMPYTTPLGFIYDSGDFPKALAKALDAADWAGFPARRAKAAERGQLRGLGLCCAIESAGAGIGDQQLPEFGQLTVHPDRTLTISAGSGDAGQGHATALAQIAERVLGWKGITVLAEGDTGVIPKGLGTFGSRTMGAAGTALVDAAMALIDQARDDALTILNVADVAFEDGAFRVAGSNRFITLEDLAARCDKTFTGSAFTSAKAGTYPNGVHLAEVEIDPQTGALTLVHYIVIDDVGTVVNPLLLAGQIHGGVAQGLGQAFLEQMVYDESGTPISASLMDYAMIRASDLSQIDIYHSPTFTEANPLGVKGAGESGTVGALAAGINAVHDALAPLGVDNFTMPATPHRIWQAIQSARGTQ